MRDVRRPFCRNDAGRGVDDVPAGDEGTGRFRVLRPVRYLDEDHISQRTERACTESGCVTAGSRTMRSGARQAYDLAVLTCRQAEPASGHALVSHAQARSHPLRGGVVHVGNGEDLVYPGRRG
jgi:hypothetical protein